MSYQAKSQKMTQNTLQVKGVAVKSLPEFVKLNLPDIEIKWLSQLPPEVVNVFQKGILVSKWYDADVFLRQPIILAAKLANCEPNEMAWKMGIYSSASALRGIYKFFLRFGGPVSLIRKVPFFLETYYKPSNVKVLYVDDMKKEAKLEFINFVDKDDVIIHRVRGWGYNTLIEAGAQDAELEITDILEPDHFSLFIRWE